jgi:DNA polymerase-3 subunit chi
MSEVRFYHLTTQSIEQALPAILTKALSGGRKAVIRFTSEQDVHHFNDHLWTYNPNSFLPHGAKADGHALLQPVYLTAANENPNGADTLVLCNAQTVPENIADFALCCDFLNGNDDEAIEAGRARWKEYKAAGHAVTYWQQTESGGWEQKA